MNKLLLQKGRSLIVQRVNLVDPLADDLLARDIISQEKYNNILNGRTPQEKMRKLYDQLNSDEAFTEFLESLKKHEPALVKDLEKEMGDELAAPKKSTFASKNKQESTEYPTTSVCTKAHFDDTDGAANATVKAPWDFKLCTHAKLEEWISKPSTSEGLIDNLTERLESGEMMGLEKNLKDKKLKKSFCFNSNDIMKLKKNKKLELFLKAGNGKKFPDIAIDICFEKDRGIYDLNSRDETPVSDDELNTSKSSSQGHNTNMGMTAMLQPSNNSVTYPPQENSDYDTFDQNDLNSSGYGSLRSPDFSFSNASVISITANQASNQNEAHSTCLQPYSDTGCPSDKLTASVGGSNESSSSGRSLEAPDQEENICGINKQWNSGELKQSEDTPSETLIENHVYPRYPECTSFFGYDLLDSPSLKEKEKSPVPKLRNSDDFKPSEERGAPSSEQQMTPPQSNTKSSDVFTISSHAEREKVDVYESGDSIALKDSVNPKTSPNEGRDGLRPIEVDGSPQHHSYGSKQKNSLKIAKGKAKSKKRDPVKEQKKILRAWAVRKSSNQMDKLREVKGSLSIVNKSEHKEYPFLTSEKCKIYRDPQNGHTQLILVHNDKLVTKKNNITSECKDLAQYHMAVCDIQETVVLLPNQNEILLRNNNSFSDTVQLCRRFVFEVFAPAFAVFKRVQRESELFSMDIND